MNIQRVNSEIQREISNLLREVKDPRVNRFMLSVVRTETTTDLKYCKVYLSAFGEVDVKDFRRGLKSVTPFIRSGLAKNLKLRNTPELTFILDDSIEHSIQISNILKGMEHIEDPDT